MTLRPIKTLKLTLADGKEYEFLLSAGGIKRLKQKMGVTTLKEVLDQEKRDPVDCASPMLWEALIAKPPGMTEESFADLLPADIEGLSRCIATLLGQSFPDDRDARPTGGAPQEKAEAPKTKVQ